MKNKVSLCMIVKDEEEYLSKCLSSIYDIVDEMIIVDTGSSDKTVEIAKSFGAKVYYFKWNNNFSEARNESLKYATKDWILILDADDELYPEDREILKALLNSELDEKAIYYFETLSYYGSCIENENISVNINPRLFKNNRGIHYEGEVHNQLVFDNGEYNVICDSIKIHHYGYLNERIVSKDKNERNIKILKEQIKQNPNDGFAYFNLGNEYSAANDIKRALECYYKSYEDFDASRGYSFILILSIIISNYILGEYDEALKYISVGYKHFPKCTDLYFYESLIWNALNRPTLQIRALEKCVEIGEPPSEFKFLYGAGTFRAYYELGNAYFKCKDYSKAYDNYVEAMKIKPDYIEPLFRIGKLLAEQNVPIDEFKCIIEKFFPEDKKPYYSIILDIFYSVDYYGTALEYINKCEAEGNVTENIIFLKSACLIKNGNFEENLNLKDINKNSAHYTVFLMYKVLSAIILKNYDYATDIISSIDYYNQSIQNKKFLEVYSELTNLFTKKQNKILSEDENDKEYIDIILEILEILLINKKFDELKIAVNLLNLVNKKYSLLYLGKLYYKHGYIELAKKEILRSIKELEIYDSESIDILKN